MKFKLGMIAALLAIVFVGLLFTFQRPPNVMVQRGFRGTGMDQVINKHDEALKEYANQLPPVVPAEEPAGSPASAVYSNVKVLGDVDAIEFGRLMTAMTNWVSPKQGCSYCHNTENMASDELYTKVVARRMIQMVRQINSDWKTHVAGTGVTCYTCHRGQPVPAYVWFDPAPVQSLGSLGNRAGVSAPAVAPGMTSLPYDPFTPFLEQDNNIRVASTTALPGTNHQSIKQTEWTYSLMMHFSTALGVNCTYCHNTRSFTDWDQSTPQRGTAWYGIRMVRDLNDNFLDPLKATLPPLRWGPHGDGPKVNCATCHQGVFKPLYGASMLKDYQELAGLVHAASLTEEPATAAAPAPVAAAPTPKADDAAAPAAPAPKVAAPAPVAPAKVATAPAPAPVAAAPKMAAVAPVATPPKVESPAPAAAPPASPAPAMAEDCAVWSHACGAPAAAAPPPQKVSSLETALAPAPPPFALPGATGCAAWWSHACSDAVSAAASAPVMTESTGCAAWSHACDAPALASAMPEVTGCTAWWSHACDAPGSTAAAPAAASTEAMGCAAWSHACDAPGSVSASPPEPKSCSAWSHAC